MLQNEKTNRKINGKEKLNVNDRKRSREKGNKVNQSETKRK
jgi:hypothetical protein